MCAHSCHAEKGTGMFGIYFVEECEPALPDVCVCGSLVEGFQRHESDQ